MKSLVRVSALFVLITVTLSFSAFFAAGAEEEVIFSINDKHVQTGRLFETEIVVSNASGLSAFSAVVEYDPSVLQYRNGKSSVGEVNVNSLEAGKLRLVFLNEDGVDTDSMVGTVTLEFKALLPAESKLVLRVDEAVNTEAEDMVFTTGSESIIHISASSGSSDKDVSYEEDHIEAETESSINAEKHGDITVGSSKLSADTIISVALLAVFLAGILVWISYRLGMKKQKEKTSVPIEKPSDFSGKQYIKGEIKDEENP